MNVDFVATDWGTVGQRRAMKNPPAAGRLEHLLLLARGRRLQPIRPPTPPSARTATAPGSAGRTSPSSRQKVTEWFEAPNLDAEKKVIGELNRAALENVVYAPTGFFLGYQAWRRNLSGIVKGPLPFFWNGKS
jgi:peptide/nickel transport system substrate-binding protein